jgi:purine-nucleoside phosphorylase
MQIMSKMLAIDFTGGAPGLQQYSSFGEEVMRFIRNELPAKCLVIVDCGYGLPVSHISLVCDHLNLTGSNPLVGTNHPCGERFTKMTDVYITDVADKLPKVVTAGLKNGIKPTAEEVLAINAVGGQCWSFNLVPAMIVAAHAGLRVLGILLPESTDDKIQFKAEIESICQAVSGKN